MPYTEFAKFQADYEACQSTAMAYYKLTGIPYVSATVAWNLYVNTSKASLGFQIFGRHIFDAQDQINLFMNKMKPNSSGQLPSFMVGITNTELNNMGKTSDIEGGSVLLIGKDKWNFTVNDTWLLGGANSLQEFYPASPVTKRNILHNNFILTITGRELVGLALAGYKEVQSGYDAIGKTYAPGDRPTAQNLSLVDYQVALANLKSVGDAEAFFANKGFTLAP
jgi:hypothetical protein